MITSSLKNLHFPQKSAIIESSAGWEYKTYLIEFSQLVFNIAADASCQFCGVRPLLIKQTEVSKLSCQPT